MAKPLCPNTTCDQNNYSAPMPIVGLYIAAASLVCFILMFSDVVLSIRRQKRWLPCRLFSLNSVTLTLLAIATKLPVDLTTSMPTSHDQLSKLTGTTLLCACMGFLLPSLGINRASESFTNMAAMSILVITVVVNICVQMATGLIFSFIPEHIIIMYSMLSMLSLLWFSSWAINEHKAIHSDYKKSLDKKKRVSIFKELKLCYLHAYASDPQLALSRSTYSLYAGFICSFCLIIVLQVTVRSLLSDEFIVCNEFSDYRWSMRIIVVIQLLVILLASVVTGFRWPAIYQMPDKLPTSPEILFVFAVLQNFPYLKGDVADYPCYFVRILMVLWLKIMRLLLQLPCWVVTLITSKCWGWFGREHTQLEGIQEYGHLLTEKDGLLEEWGVTKCMVDMKKRMSISDQSKSLHNLRKLFVKRGPSQWSFDFKVNSPDYNVSCLYLVYIARLVSLTIPCVLSRHLTQSLSEVFDIIYFVDTTMNFLGLRTKKRCKLAKAMWMGKDLCTDLSKIHTRSMNESQLDVVCAREISRELDIIDGVYSSLGSFVQCHLSLVRNYINGNNGDYFIGRSYRTVEDLYNHLEGLYVDVLHVFLSQLPCAILKVVEETPIEECEEIVRPLLKFICQAQSLDELVYWSFPDGSGITSLISSHVPSTRSSI